MNKMIHAFVESFRISFIHADAHKSSRFSKVLNFCKSNVPLWNLKRNNYENVSNAVNARRSLYWGEPEGIGVQPLNGNQNSE